MSRFNIKLNGWDASAAFNKWGVSYQQTKVTGQAQGISLGGATIMDVLKVKDILVLPGNGVNETTFAKISALSRLDYVTAIYTHPETKKSVTKVMMPTLSAATRTPIRAGDIWYEGWVLTLEER